MIHKVRWDTRKDDIQGKMDIWGKMNYNAIWYIRSGYRYGDNAPKAFIELVDKDFNAKGQDSGPSQKKTDIKEKEKVEEKKDKK